MTYLIEKEKMKITELDKKRREEIGNKKSLIKCAKLGERGDIPCTQLSNLGKYTHSSGSTESKLGKIYAAKYKGSKFIMIYIQQGEQVQIYGKYMLQGADYQNMG